ncbi:MAG: Rha family transcriptional regulator [Magnetococcales bacterium]|nr:Rha family transcriptional regulator [Magnetococcales bacterium]
MNSSTATATPIVFIHNGQPTTTSLVVAEGVKYPHKSVIQLIRQYQQDLELFGRVAFEMRPFETPGGQQKQEVAILNERQTTLILTYMRNGPITRRFKIALVQAFYRLAGECAMFSNADIGLLAELVALWTRANASARKRFLAAISDDINTYLAAKKQGSEMDVRPQAPNLPGAEGFKEIIVDARAHRDADVLLLCGYTLGTVGNPENPVFQAAIRTKEGLAR